VAESAGGRSWRGTAALNEVAHVSTNVTPKRQREPETREARLVRKDQAWLKPLRWFAAEWAVVVAGVLIALGLGSIYQTQQDHDREAVYLRQLAADLDETLRLMDDAETANLEWDRSLAALLRAYRGDEAPPKDSVLRWMADLQFDNPVPVLGTADALVQTGDLQLIRDPDLRSALTSYLSRMREYNLPWLLSLEDDFVAARTLFRSRFDILEAPPVTGLSESATTPVSVLDQVGTGNPYPLDVGRMIADREAYGLLTRMLLVKRSLLETRATFRREAQALRHTLEASVPARPRP
jgi:hypothetical protein